MIKNKKKRIYFPLILPQMSSGCEKDYESFVSCSAPWQFCWVVAAMQMASLLQYDGTGEGQSSCRGFPIEFANLGQMSQVPILCAKMARH